MADAKTSALPENLTPASTVVFPAMSADGNNDYRVPYSVFTAAIAAAQAAAESTASADATSKVAAEAALARNADNLTSGTVADARIASTIARDSEVTTAVSTHAGATDPHGDRAYTDDEIVALPSLEDGTEITYTLAGSPPSETLTPVLSPTRFTRILCRPVGASLTASNVAASLITSTIVPAANSIAVGDMLTFHMSGSVLNNVGTDQTLTLRLRCGSGNLMSGGALTLPTSATARAWTFDVECTVTATSGGTLFGVQGKTWVSDVTATTPIITRFFTGTDTVVDLTDWTADAFDVTGQHNTTSGSMTTVCNGLTITQVRP